jgi:hypothetical protein
MSSLDISDLSSLVNADGELDYASAVLGVKRKLGILPGQKIGSTQKGKIKERQMKLLRSLRHLNTTRSRKLAEVFLGAFATKGVDLHSTSQRDINEYIHDLVHEQLESSRSVVSTPLGGTRPTKSSGPGTSPDSPLLQTTPRASQRTPQQEYALPTTPGFSPIQDILDDDNFGDPEITDEATLTKHEASITHGGDIFVEQPLQESMEMSSDLVSKAADAVDASAKATTDLQKTVQDTTAAVNALVTAQKKTESASPALSQQVLAQIQADPAIAKLVSDGLLKWDDLLGKNPGPGQPGHVSGVEPGDPVVLPDKLQKVINNLQTAQTREAASLKGAIETNQAARTTTGFRQSAVGYYPQAQVWMPIRAPPASLPGRR